uniref:Glutathione S-transferase n=1 Tax=Leptobrachium leishanense TaxID=445787 RepID=A0A8C5PHK5_9ANUR
MFCIYISHKVHWSGDPLSGYKIIYFDVRGRCEGMRILLADQGAEWNEEVLTFDQWLKGDQKAKAVFGQLPGFQDGDCVLYQSNAIMRYLARKHGVYGKDLVTQSRVDMMNDGVEDLRVKYLRMVYQNYEEGKEPYIQSLPAELKHFERALRENNNGQSFIVGNEISFADYNLVDLLHNHLVLAPECLKEFSLPLLTCVLVSERERSDLTG